LKNCNENIFIIAKQKGFEGEWSWEVMDDKKDVTGIGDDFETVSPSGILFHSFKQWSRMLKSQTSSKVITLKDASSDIIKKESLTCQKNLLPSHCDFFFSFLLLNCNLRNCYGLDSDWAENLLSSKKWKKRKRKWNIILTKEMIFQTKVRQK